MTEKGGKRQPGEKHKVFFQNAARDSKIKTIRRESGGCGASEVGFRRW